MKLTAYFIGLTALAAVASAAPIEPQRRQLDSSYRDTQSKTSPNYDPTAHNFHSENGGWTPANNYRGPGNTPGWPIIGTHPSKPAKRDISHDNDNSESG